MGLAEEETCGSQGDEFDRIKTELYDEVDDLESLASPRRCPSTESNFPEAPQIVRCNSAPPIHCIPNVPTDHPDELTGSFDDISIGGKEITGLAFDDIKIQKNFYASYQYFHFYYSKNPRDKTLPRPLYNPSQREKLVDVPKQPKAIRIQTVATKLETKENIVKPVLETEHNRQKPQQQGNSTFADCLARERKLHGNNPNHFRPTEDFGPPGLGYHGNHQHQYDPYYHHHPHSYPATHPNMNYENYEQPYHYHGHQRPYQEYNSHRRSGFRQWMGRSPPKTKTWLDELKTNAVEDASILMEIVNSGNLMNVIVDSEGSRYVQGCLENASIEEKQVVFNVISSNINHLCTNPFGNYVIQKFFDYGNSEHKPYITRKLMGEVLRLSLDMYGCRVIQKAIDHASSDTLLMLVMELNENNGIRKCIDDQNGNHVIQKCIEKAEPFVIDKIMESFKRHITLLAQHVYGCRVIQRLLGHCNKQQKIPILMQILTETEALSKNEFGNYVIQYIVSHGDLHDRKSIIERVQNKVLDLSKNKFGSNVIETCFQHCDINDRNKFIDEVLGTNNPGPLLEMIKDQYGNYVIQKLIGVCNEIQQRRIFSRISTLNVDLSRFPFGKYTLARMEQIKETTSPILAGRTVPQKVTPKTVPQKVTPKPKIYLPN